ncbi:MAG TPA: HAD hydrolase-like protein [Thermoanaerobaculia bacterium]|jgi:phosphoglycolate phosphatase-like HAD superfamily hydrolase
MKLVLFDIDGTLITDGGASRDAFAAALLDAFEYNGDLRRYDFSGRTDPQIAHMVLRDAGWSERDINARMPGLWEKYLHELEQHERSRVRELPGIRKLLDTLRRHVTLGLLTGNIERGARLKLSGPRLNGYFPFGAFGSDSPRREDLLPIAVQRSGERFNARDVVIIGDSIYDIRCGTPHSATTIAIASGKTSAELLRAENPDHFFASAEDRDGLLAAILG